MKKELIIEELKKHDSTVLSFPDRGPWGSSSYRGNCSGWIPAYFIWKYGINKVAEIFAGSGTTYDVCRDMNVSYTGIDLNPNPVRDGIIPMNILDTAVDLPDGFYDADMLFIHPPYPSIKNVHYSNSMWKDTANISQHDIQEMNWDDGMKAVNKSIMRGYSAMQPGAYEVILVGEIRSNGQYFSMFRNLAIPGILHQTFIKLQHNCVSNKMSYKKSDFTLIGHEMIAVIKKPSGYEIAYVMPKEYKVDIRDSQAATWKDVVYGVLRSRKSEFTLDEIYNEISCHCKAKRNPHWKEKVRQVLQQLEISNHAVHPQKGVWMVA